MKVILFYKGIYPDNTAPMSKRLHLYARALQEKDCTVQILTYNGNGRRGRGICDGIEFEYLTTMHFYKFAIFIMPSLQSILQAYQVCKRTAKNDIVCIIGLGWFGALSLIAGIMLAGGKIIMEINENPYSPEGGRLDPVWFRKIRRWIMLHGPVKLADGFIVISRSLELLFRKYARKNALIIRVPILINEGAISPKCKTNPYHTFCPYLFHAGSLSETKDGVIAMFKAFIKASEKLHTPIFFILTNRKGPLVLLQQIDRMLIEKNLLRRVIYTGYLSEVELDAVREEAALAIVNKPSNWQNDYNFPTKLGELLLAEVPVIASGNGEMATYLQHKKNALLVKANDSDAISESIITLIKDSDLAQTIREGGKQLAVNEFSLKKNSPLLRNFMNRIDNL